MIESTLGTLITKKQNFDILDVGYAGSRRLLISNLMEVVRREGKKVGS